MAEILTTQNVKDALGITDATQDAKLALAVPSAIAAIKKYTGRDFTNPVSASSTKTYYYDGSGILEIDDAAAVTVVNLDGVVLLADEYVVEPPGEPVKTWITLPNRRVYPSPAMGFMRNLDKLWWKVAQTPQVVQVTATWGWAAIPDDVRQAAVWTAVAFMESPRPFTSESIAGYSRSRSALREAIPTRAKDLLEPYTKGWQ